MSLSQLAPLNLIFWGVVLLAVLMQESRADVITIEANVHSVNPSERNIKVDRKGKQLTLEMSRTAEVVIGNKKAALTNVSSGQKVKIDFETNFEIVTRIEVTENGNSSQPELIPLTELDGEGSEDAPWLSSDGKQIYWTVATGPNPKWIWSATRTDANAMFADKGRLFPCADFTLSDDGNEIIVLTDKPFVLAAARRSDHSRPFARPSTIKELERRFGFLAAPSLSIDGRSLYFDRFTSDGPIISVSTRQSDTGRWQPPQPVKLVRSEHTLRFPFVSADGKFLFCVATDVKEESKPNLLMFTRSDGGPSYEDPTLLEFDGFVAHGKFPRYVAETNELFFSRPKSKSESELVVIKNFSPEAFSNSK